MLLVLKDSILYTGESFTQSVRFLYEQYGKKRV